MRNLRAIAILLWLFSGSAAAADPLPLFDCHLHYSFGAPKEYPPAQAIALLDRAGIRRAILSSTPNDGTLALHAAYPDRFVPFLRPYRKAREPGDWAAERASWYRDPETIAFIESELARGIYGGIGEFHVNGNEVDTPVMRSIVDIAVKRKLLLLAHSDAAAIERLFAFNPSVRIIWAHTGMGESVELVRRTLEKYPTLMAELSYRSGIADGTGLSAPWRELFTRFSDRFVYGSDTWVSSRWPEVPALADAARSWLNQLPRDVAEKIAFRNAERALDRDAVGVR